MQDLTTYLKQAVLPEHRIILIGTTSYPEVADAKLLKGFFEKFIYFPVPDYPSRMMLWRKSLVETVGVSVRNELYKGLAASFTPFRCDSRGRVLLSASTWDCSLRFLSTIQAEPSSGP